MKDLKDHYHQAIMCAVCKKLLGFAPYWRQEYRCVKCNKCDDPDCEAIDQ